jgi:cyclase
MRARVIPILLLQNRELVKTVRFAKPKYIGDPINAVRIFNDKEADEIVILDISATKNNRGPNFELLERITSEAFMPLAYGGGVRSWEDVRRLMRLGIEKIVLNTAAFETPGLIRDIASRVGSQAVVVSIDAKKGMFGGYGSYIRGKRVGDDPVSLAKKAVEHGAGEIMINSVDHDGMMEGYDLGLVRSVTGAVCIPVIAAGGAGGMKDLAAVTRDAGASAAAAGSLFVFYGPRKAVLITFPSQKEIATAFA